MFLEVFGYDFMDESRLVWWVGICGVRGFRVVGMEYFSEGFYGGYVRFGF